MKYTGTHWLYVTVTSVSTGTKRFAATDQLQDTGLKVLYPRVAFDALAGVLLAARQPPLGSHSTLAANINWSSFGNQVLISPNLYLLACTYLTCVSDRRQIMPQYFLTNKHMLPL